MPILRDVTITPTVLNNDAYDANDVLFDTTEIPNACSAKDKIVKLQGIAWLDKSDATVGNLTFWFFRANVSFGTKDSAPNIADADAENFIGSVAFASTLLTDAGGSKIGFLGNIGLICKPASGTNNIFVACTAAGTPTLATDCLQIKFSFEEID